MKKFTDIFCLIIWIVQLVVGVMCMINDEPVGHMAFICATLICVIHYAEELLEG